MEHVEKDGFIPASSSSEWYDNLRRNGSCLRLYDLLAERRELIHELGPKGITVLHKGVDHGCVKLVRFILVDMFDNVDGHCTCVSQGGDSPCPLTMEGLLRKTSEYGSTAVNMAVVSGSPKMIVLLKWAIDVSNTDKQEKYDRSEITQGFSETTYIGDMRSRYLREKAMRGEGRAEDINEVEQPTAPVPDVKDDMIYEEVYEEGLSTRISKVYELMEEKVLNKDWGDLQEEMDVLKDCCKKNVDFEFVPIAHVFLHFLFCIWGSGEEVIYDLLGKIFQSIILVCKEYDSEETATNGESLVVALFQILDPRGRTFVHCFLRIYLDSELWGVIKNLEEYPTLISSTIMKKCMNVRDGAGRTILHMACIDNLDFSDENYEWMIKYIDWDVIVSPFCLGKFWDLVGWCFPKFRRSIMKDVTPVLMVVIFDSFKRKSLYQFNLKCFIRSMNKKHDLIYIEVTSFSISAFLGRASIVEKILEHYSKFKALDDSGFDEDSSESWILPAMHCATISGQVETLQTILKHPIYDPNCQHPRFGTALHFLLNPPLFIPSKKDLFEHFKTIALLHVLPNSYPYKNIENDYTKHQIDDGAPRMFTSNEVSCINLLLQAGIDLWTPHCKSDEHPNPGHKANDEARKWWFDKVVNEVVTQKASITSAANATSVIGALVATTSVIGPLQPPLSYSGDDGFIDTTWTSVQVYLVCNSLSFFFSIASILMAVLPAIPMPNESMYDELLRSRRSLKAAAVMLLLSIICTLISFSSASMAVVSLDWRNRHLVVLVFGGVICVVVLVVYIIRLLRMVFHKNYRFRRLFAKYMYF